MSVKVRWYDEKEDFVLYTFIGIWSWDDYDKANQEGRALMRTKPHYVGVFNDLREVRITPSLLTSNVNSYIKTRPQNTGLTLFVTSNMFFYRVYETMTKIYPSYLDRYKMLINFDEAVANMRQWLEEHQEITFEIEKR